MGNGDFEPEGWSAFDDHGGRGVSGSAGCGCLILVAFVIGIFVTLLGK